jgi:hypothetical protein
MIINRTVENYRSTGKLDETVYLIYHYHKIKTKIT